MKEEKNELNKSPMVMAILIGLLFEALLVAGLVYIGLLSGLVLWASVVIGVVGAVVLSHALGTYLMREEQV